MFSLPEELVTTLSRLVPPEQRNAFVAEALRKALEEQEQALYECAQAVEQDAALNDELEDWQVTLTDRTLYHS
jgi:metal-responsive CopG/Arc/MetJ family transcriptional regulator